LDELASARRCLIDAERFADENDPERSIAYSEIAKAWIRMEELKTQKAAVQAFREQRFR
jgi:hypothetical protein